MPTDLHQVANEMRIDIVKMTAAAGSGHPGGSLSCADILAALYFGGVLCHDPANPEKPDRDRFILAKGHCAPALYAALAQAGYFPRDELATLRKWGSRLQGHPDSQLLPGVEVSTGSLGQGLSIAAGLACGLRLRENDARVFALLGDGECEEGQVWEAAMFAAHQQLGNLVAIVDENGLQIDGSVHEVVQTGTLAQKFEAFGWQVLQVDGHDPAALVEVLGRAKAAGGTVPHAIMAHTLKGKGVSFMEGQAGWHGKAPNAQQLAQALADLGLPPEEVDKAVGSIKDSEAPSAECDSPASAPSALRCAPSAEQGASVPADGAAASTLPPFARTAEPKAAASTLPPFARTAEEKRATREAFGATLAGLADEGVPVVAVDADLAGSTTTAKFASAKPEYEARLFNCGIAEQNMVDVAAGLSLAGHVAFTGSFAVFGTGRAYDQIRNTVCYSNLNVKICPTHAGVSVGPDGGSHQMLEDVALMSALPNMRVLVPADYEACRAALRLAAETPGPVYVRMGRAAVPAVYAPGVQLQMGKAYILREGSDVSIIANGVEIREALLAAEALAAQGIQAEVVDAFCVKPLDVETIVGSVAKTGCAVVCEEHSVNGGLCAAVSQALAVHHPAPCGFVAVADRFGKSASFEELMDVFGLNSASIVEAVKKTMPK